MKIAFLIPSKSMKKWKNLQDSYLMKYLIPSVMKTISPEHKYTFYYAIDDNDKLYNKIQTKKKLLNKDTYKQFNNSIKNIDIQILSTKNIEKGNVVGYWNMLFKKAYDDGHDYFVQSGDDILYHTKDWLNLCIYHLILNIDLGVSTPQDIGNPNLMTQSVVSRKHMEIFGYYYPPELKSWFCDNWITDIYKHSLGVIPRCSLENKGGKPRYTPPDWETTKILCQSLVDRDQPKLINYINDKCIV